MRLERYVAQEEIKLEELVDLIGDVSISGVRKWMRGERIPRPDQMRRIAVVTNGSVLPNDFILAEVEAAE